MALLLAMTAGAVIYYNLQTPDSARLEGAEIRGAREWELLRHRDPKTGRIPEGIRARELAFAATLPGSYSNIQNKKLSGLLANEWNLRGPSNIGGRTRALAQDITNPAVILAGGVTGSMWKSTNDGQSWTNTTRPDQMHSSTCISQDIRQRKENVWYYGTGELRGSSAISGDGIFKSTDGGDSWFLLPKTSTKKPNSWENSFDYVWNIAINPANKDQDEVYAATSMGAINRSTNGGYTWDIVLGGLGPDRSYFTDVAVSPKGVVYAALSSFAAGNECVSKGIFRSTDGVNWADITPDNWSAETWRIVIGIAPSDENQVYFLAETPHHGKLTRDLYRDSMYHSLWKYTYLEGDGTGAKGIWEDRSQSLPSPADWRGHFNSQESYNLGIKVKPDNPNVVFIAGTNLYRSDDGFKTENKWKWIGGYMEGIVGNYKEYPNHHPDVHTLFFDYNNPDILYTGTDGGVHKTLNNMKDSIDWISLNNSYLTTQFYSVSLNQYSSDDITVIGGMQDNCSYWTNSMDLNTGWKQLMNSDGFCCAVGGKNLYYISKNRVYQPKIYIARVITDDNGNVLTSARIDPAGGMNFLWNTPFTLDPNDSNKMYLAGGQVVWRNSDLSKIPFVNSKDSTAIGWDSLAVTFQSNSKISAVQVSKQPANVLYYGTSTGKVFKVENADSGNLTAIDITGTNFPPNSYVSSIAIDPKNADRAIVAFSNYNVVSLFLTTDVGKSWTAVAGNLEEYPSGSGAGPSVHWIEILPVGNGFMYLAGTTTGVYATSYLEGMNTVWVQMGAETIGNVVVDMIDARESDGYVVVGTHGAGVYSSFITSLFALPQSPVLISPVKASAGILENVTLQWGPVAGAAWYRVQVSDRSDFSNIVWEQGGIKDTKIECNDLEQGRKTYYWRVIASNEGGQSPPSEAWNFITAIEAPQIIYPADAATDVPLNIEVKWNAVQGALSYRFLAATNITFGKLIADTVVNSLSFPLSALESNKKYYVKIASTDNNGTGVYCKTLTFRTVNLGSAGDEYINSGNIIKSIYPVPAISSATLDLNLPANSNVKIRLINLNGQIIKEVYTGYMFAGDNSIQLNLTGIKSGSCFLELSFGNRKEIRKISIVQ